MDCMMIGKPTENIVDRKDEVVRIVNSMLKPKTSVNYALLGHRRIGKSTIILEAKRNRFTTVTSYQYRKSQKRHQ